MGLAGWKYLNYTYILWVCPWPLNQEKPLTWPPPSTPYVLSPPFARSNCTRPISKQPKPGGCWTWSGTMVALNLASALESHLWGAPECPSLGEDMSFLHYLKWLYCASKNSNYCVKRKKSRVWGPFIPQSAEHLALSHAFVEYINIYPCWQWIALSRREQFPNWCFIKWGCIRSLTNNMD